MHLTMNTMLIAFNQVSAFNQFPLKEKNEGLWFSELCPKEAEACLEKLSLIFTYHI